MLLIVRYWYLWSSHFQFLMETRFARHWSYVKTVRKRNEIEKLYK